MTEIPKHLQNRAREARERANRYANASQEEREAMDWERRLKEGMPAHLRGISQDMVKDPFEQKKQDTAQKAAALLTAKSTLVTALRPIRQHVSDSTTDLDGRFLTRNRLRAYAATTPAKIDIDSGIIFALRSSSQVFFDIDDTKAIRIGEQRTWGLVVPKNEIGVFLKGAGKRPVRDTIQLTKKGSLFAEHEHLKPTFINRVFEEATVETATNSVTVYEGAANPNAYKTTGYGDRVGTSVTIVRNPSDAPEEEGVFGVGFCTIDSKAQLEEKPFDDHIGTYLSESVGPIISRQNDAFPDEKKLVKAFGSAAVVLGAFSETLADHSRPKLQDIYREVDVALQSLSSVHYNFF